MTGLVVSFSGRMASGKTHITRVLADALQWPRASFGEYLRAALAKQGNHRPSRETLQDFGQTLVTRDPDQFCRDVLGGAGFAPGDNLLLDGIRHVDIQWRVAKFVAPSRTFLIYLAAEDDVLAQRGRERGVSQTEFRRAQDHEVEQDLATSLPRIADVVIDAGQPTAQVLAQCIVTIERHGGDPAALARAAGILTRPGT
jgi:AAA domain